MKLKSQLEMREHSKPMIFWGTFRNNILFFLYVCDIYFNTKTGQFVDGIICKSAGAISQFSLVIRLLTKATHVENRILYFILPKYPTYKFNITFCDNILSFDLKEKKSVLFNNIS